MTVHIPGAVSLVAVAKQLRQPPASVEKEARALLMFIGTDWRGEPALAEPDAAALVSGHGRSQHDADAAWREHIALTEDWQRRRDEAVNVARGIAHRAGVLRGLGDPASSDGALQAGRDAGTRFEQANPPPEMDNAPTGERLYTSESALRRLVSRIAGVA